MTSHNQSDKKSVTLEGLTIQNTRDLKVICIWPPMNNFSLIKKICDRGRLDDSEFMET
jgi:hypothetical protein